MLEPHTKDKPAFRDPRLPPSVPMSPLKTEVKLEDFPTRFKHDMSSRTLDMPVGF
jgi:hypothetical protein